MNPDLFKKLILPAKTKIVMLILDGLGGLPREPAGKTELETACRPNMDALAARSALGLTVPAGPGITVGSGPGHLGLFGYDPLAFQVGRGVLEALGIEFDLRAGDLAARGNFCTVDGAGLITDRRAGRIATDVCVRLTERLRTIVRSMQHSKNRFAGMSQLEILEYVSTTMSLAGSSRNGGSV